MDWFPLYNSLRIALIASVIVFFSGIFAAYYIAKLPPAVKGVLDVVLTLPLVLPPTVVGYFLLMLMGPRRPFGAWVLETFGTKMVMTWYSGIFAAAVVAFPLMYRTARGALEQVNVNLIYAARTLGMSETKIFFRIQLPAAWPGVAAATILAFARAMGEFGATIMLAGNIPGRTQTMSVAIYTAVQSGDRSLAYYWVAIIMGISFFTIFLMNYWMGYQERRGGGKR